LTAFPDLQEDTTAQFLQCKLAYEILYDTNHRQQYNQYLHSNQAATLTSKNTNPARRPASPCEDTYPYASVAAAAVGCNRQGISHIPGSRHSIASLPGAVGGDAPSSVPPDFSTTTSIPAHLRKVLFQEHGVVLEQFSTIEEALLFLEEVESSLLQQHDPPKWQEPYFRGQEESGKSFLQKGDDMVGSSVSNSMEGQGGSAFTRGEARYGAWHPGRFTPRNF
jgi:hypothetical protein